MKLKFQYELWEVLTRLDKIEHRFLPALDLEIHGECQSLLLNYEKILTEEFGSKYSLCESLAIPLQMISVNLESRNKIMKELQSREYQTVKEYIDNFRFSLDDSVWEDSTYSFRVFLVPKIGNKEKSSDVAVDFIKYDSTKPEEMEKYRKIVAFIKEKQVPVINPGKLKPKDVSQKIEEELNITFHQSSHHAMCWRHYDVRPPSDSEHPEKTKIKYCQYDIVHDDYVYTEEWVNFLLKELSSLEKRRDILGIPYTSEE